MCEWLLGRQLIVSSVKKENMGRTHDSFPTFPNLRGNQKTLRKFGLWNTRHVFSRLLCIIRPLNTSMSQSPKKALVSFLTLCFLFPRASTSALDISY